MLSRPVVLEVLVIEKLRLQVTVRYYHSKSNTMVLAWTNALTFLPFNLEEFYALFGFLQLLKCDLFQFRNKSIKGEIMRMTNFVRLRLT